MKKILLVYSILAPLAFSSCTTTPSPPAIERAKQARTQIQSPLRVEGRHLVNAEGETVQLRGVNAGTWLLIEPWMIQLQDHPGVVAEKDIWDILGRRFGEEKKRELIRTYRENFFTEQDVQRIADLGLNCLRVPIWWRAVSDPEYGGDLTYLDRVISWCSANGVYVILDLHGVPGGQSKECKIVGERTQADLWKHERFKQQAIEWWETVATRYKGNPVIAGYDLINEAMDANMDDLIELYDRMYRAVRAIDPDRILIIEDGLLGFHRLPRPLDMGWENVIYSLHYYPQNTEEGFAAPERDFHRMNRSSIWFGVPTYMGEFNSIQLDRGGAASFLRHVEVFDYFGWSWTWWTYKMIEDNRDYNWGITGFVPEVKPINLHEDSFESIRHAFAAFRTEALDTHPLLEPALRQPIRWRKEPKQAGIIRLGLDTVYLYPENETLRYEWGRAVPNIGYWGPGERVAWPFEIDQPGSYEFGIRYANGRAGNMTRVWLNKALVTDSRLPHSGGWGKYRDQSLLILDLPEGRNVIEVSQADEHDSFINLQHGWLKKTALPAVSPSERLIRLHPLNAEPLRKGTPLRIEWWHNPPNFGYWHSGEEVAWVLSVKNGGRYRATASYSTDTSQTELTLLLNGESVWSGKLTSTGGWHQFADENPEATLQLNPGENRIALRWNTPHPGGAGNLRGLTLIRVED